MLASIVKYVYPSPALSMLIHKIGNTEYMGANILPAYALLIELNSHAQVRFSKKILKLARNQKNLLRNKI